ncbi:RAMP superfamily CRISPR-associated protein [Haliangium ochraceum]|uniref:CRISPR type III-associated protein domain-containing protein n=1 Tax=Haliangium ochraceum (strain DSM 14365 / JCM 11303 / SMP-2) TaxID=502025 RepID=D0LG44_HALO1|nr:RAMP superfamily CRISPR-associated protein [Haliangium ochraceum]ACY18069.1 protein of unknown function DUF324 [Haliangium ochraceum DSM 14365]
MFRKSLNRAVLRIRVTTETPLLIRAGDSGLDAAASDLSPVRTEHGSRGLTVYIPGSSLKGVLRAAAEASIRGMEFARSSGNQYVDGACADPLDNKGPCASANGKKRDRSKPSSAEVYAAQCMACRLFGSLSVRGRAAVRDLFPWDAEKPADSEDNFGKANTLEQRYGVSIDRVKGSVRHGPFDQELVPAGVSFWGEIALQNYQVWQLGLLVQAFDAVNFGAAQLGSSKSRGLGAARIEVVSLVHEQSARAADHRPRGLGTLLDDDERNAYGLLVESTLPDASAELRGLSQRFEAHGVEIAPWLAAGRDALKGLRP